MRLSRSLFKVYCFIAFISFTLRPVSAAAKQQQQQQCEPHHHPVIVPINVHLLFAGSIPLFMRSPKWTSEHRNHFLSNLSSIVRHPVLDFNDESLNFTSPILTRWTSKPKCSVIEYSYTYDITIVDDEPTLSNLHTSLSSILNASDANYIHAPSVANIFYSALSHQYISEQQKQQNHYHILIYNTLSIAPEYGYYVNKNDHHIVTSGMASFTRFAFIDVSARPFFFQQQNSISQGELLTSSSKSIVEYASILHSIVSSSLITPPISKHMRQFPHESRMTFTLHRIDTCSFSLPYNSNSNDCHDKNCEELGKSLNHTLLIDVLHHAFNHISKIPKELSIDVHTPNMNDDARVTMAVARALSTKGYSHLILDTNQLFNDIVSSDQQLLQQQSSNGGKYERNALFIDSSFVVHIPLYLFSFCDETRDVHLDKGENVHGAVEGKRAIFLVENRNKHNKHKHKHKTMTTESINNVLKLLCGLSESSLEYVNMEYMKYDTIGVIPIIIKDQIFRNVIIRKIDWSEQSVASKAEELLNFEGLDIAHAFGSEIEKRRNDLHENLLNLRDVWKRQFHSTTQSQEIEIVTSHVVIACERVASTLHDEICHQRFSQEVLMKTEVDDEADSENGGGDRLNDESGGSSVWSHLLIIILSSVAGVVLGVVTYKPPNAFESESESSSTDWFSTFTSSLHSNKSKTS